MAFRDAVGGAAFHGVQPARARDCVLDTVFRLTSDVALERRRVFAEIMDQSRQSSSL